MPLTITTPPSEEPLTLAEAKAHLRVSHSEDDSAITALIVSARQWAEAYTARAFVTQSWELRLEVFPTKTDYIEIPLPTLRSIESLKYIDTDGDLQTWDASNYRVDIHTEPGRVSPAYGVSWPSIRSISGAVVIAFTAGYGDASAVDQVIKTALLLDIEKHYEREERAGDYLDDAIKALLAPYRIFHM